MKSDVSTFTLNFMGQLVCITTTQTVSSTVMTPEGPIVETYPRQVIGVLVEEDNDHFYLTQTGEIKNAIKKTEYVDIEIYEEPDLGTQILDSMPEPEKEEDLN